MMLAAEYLSTQRRRNIFVVQGSSVFVEKKKNICEGGASVFVSFSTQIFDNFLSTPIRA